MSHKVHPYIHRLGIVTEWKSRWFNVKKYQGLLKTDILLRDYLRKRLAKMGVKDAEIERSGNVIKVIIKSARPGLLIGRGGTGIEKLQKDVEQFIKKTEKESANPSWQNVKDDPKKGKTVIKVDVEEVKSPDSQAILVAQSVADQIEKRISFRRALKATLAKVSQLKEVEGIKIKISGRLDGSEIARTEWLAKGKIPLQTIRADVDYGFCEANCSYGKIGVKVWIYRGEIFKK